MSTTTAAAVQVGDYFYSSWGYDQTNVDFYKVVGMTASGKSVKVQKWSSRVTDEVGSSAHVVPGEGPAMFSDWSAVTPGMDYDERLGAVRFRPAAVRTKRLSSGGYSGPAFTVNSYAVAFHWDGSPKYQTAHGYGH